MDFNKKNIWIVTDGSQGMISQVNGLAQQLSARIFNIKINLIFPWSVLQPGFLPIYRWIFKNKIDIKNKPHIVISCGRRSVYFSLYLKKLFMKKIITIHIQNPKINFNKFDFIISPNHDNINGINVIKSVGAIHHFTKKMIESKNNSSLSISKNNLISFIIGGNNRHYKFTKESLLDLINKIKYLKKKYTKFNFLVISSRRTESDIIRFMKEKLDKIAHIWNGVDENPYIFALNYSKFFVVTSDSTSMISECASTGKPIFVFHLPYKRFSKRIESFHHEFEDLNITKKFLDDNDLNPWQYETLDEAKRISGIIKERIIKGFNESR